MTKSTASNVVELMPETQIVAYDPFRSQLAELKAINEKTIFQYDTVSGFTAAKSYIRKLQLTAGSIERVRKAEKAESWNYGKLVDKQAKEIEGEVRAMIAVHQKHIDEIEAKEETRINAIRARIDRIKAYQVADGRTEAQCAAALKNLAEVKIDESFGEFQVEVTIEIAKAIEAQTNRQEVARQEEEAARVLAEEKAAATAEAQRIRDEAIAREAADRATREAEEKAKAQAESVQRNHDAEIKAAQEREEAAARAADLALQREKEEKEKAERQAEADKAAAEWNLEQERLASERREREAVEAEQHRVAAEAKRVADETAAREADKAHKASINRAAMEVIQQLIGGDGALAIEVIKAIAKGEVPNVKITY